LGGAGYCGVWIFAEGGAERPLAGIGEVRTQRSLAGIGDVCTQRSLAGIGDVFTQRPLAGIGRAHGLVSPDLSLAPLAEVAGGGEGWECDAEEAAAEAFGVCGVGGGDCLWVFELPGNATFRGLE